MSHSHPLAESPVEPLLLSTVRVRTSLAGAPLTAASGFFFERGRRLFLVTSRHVLYDEPTKHFPDAIELVLHARGPDLTRTCATFWPLYDSGRALWRQGRDGGGEIDVAVLELDRARLPADSVLSCFGPQHLQPPAALTAVGTSLLLAGFPLGFYDTVHHLPVVRHATIASAFGVRFQGHGYFLTDARTHRGSSGAPVVMAHPEAGAAMPWWLVGVHSARMDMGSREEQDESLGLNCAWYADILLTLTADAATGPPSPSS